MHVSKKLVYLNLCALVVNALFLFLAAVRVRPPLLTVTIIVACLASCIAFSAKVNGKTLRKRYPFHSAPTERMIVVTRREDGSYN